MIKMVNCDYTIRSDVGSKILEEDSSIAFSVIYSYSFHDDSYCVSLRGNDQSPPLDVISAYFGGGGHPKAAGFAIYGQHSKSHKKNSNNTGDMYTVFKTIDT